MDKSRYLECLAADYARLREVVTGTAPDTGVPSCPEWMVADLVRHVAEVYVDKTETIRSGAEQQWPPKLSEDEPVAALDRAYAELVAELDAREPGEPAATWFKPEQTMGFWVRRMAQETVIHRVDAELAAGVALAVIPGDLAVDGIDEVLVRFLSYDTHEYREYRADHLAACDGRTVRVDAGGAAWWVRLDPSGVDVTTEQGDADARVSGAAPEVLLWLWGRAGDETVTRDGDPALIATLRRLLVVTTQ